MSKSTEPTQTPLWAPTGVRCQCGADITEWHTRARARTLLRYYGDGAGRVVACPACVTMSDNSTSSVTSVPKAVGYRKPESSVTVVDEDARLDAEYAQFEVRE